MTGNVIKTAFIRFSQYDSIYITKTGDATNTNVPFPIIVSSKLCEEKLQNIFYYNGNQAQIIGISQKY